MLRAYKYRLYPTIKQARLLDQHFAACRIVYNLALEVRLYAYSSQRIFLNSYDLNKQLPELKQEFAWLQEVNSQALQSEMKNLDNAFTNFYHKRADFPKFRSKRKWKPSFKSPQRNKLDIEKSKLKITNFQEGIKIRLERLPKGELRNVTISKSSTGKYFASITYETGIDNPVKKHITESTAIGIDLGLKHFAILSNGQKVDNPRYFRKSQDRLKVLQKRLSRKVKGSNRRKSHQHKINVLYEKIANQRKDFQHKLSNQITNDYDTICMEDLNIKGMMSRCKPKQDEDGKHVSNQQAAKSGLNKSIGDASWYQFKQMIRYKSEWKGKNLLECGKLEPSSKMCSCGVINHDLTLDDREWDCSSCGQTHDRDILAANNIKRFALANHSKLNPGCMSPVVDVELPTIVGVMKRQYVHV